MATLPAIGYADEHETEISYKCSDCSTENEVTNRIPWGMQCELFAEAKLKRKSPTNNHQKPSQEKEPQMEELLKLLGVSGTSMEHTYLAIIAYLDQAETLANIGRNKLHIPASLALKLGEVKQDFIQEFAKANEEFTLAPMREEAKEK